MRKPQAAIAAVGIAVLALALAGCRYSATYTINADDTVTGRIYTALYQDPAEDPVDASVQGDADSIAATFVDSSITPHNEGDWVGFYVYFNNEPLATFASPPENTWDIQILKSGGQYQAFGYVATDENLTRSSATEDSGYLELDVYFPGTLVEATGATETNVGLGWAHFDMLSQPLGTTPYAKGKGPSAPVPPPGPAPVETVVITPGPEPVPEASPASSLSPSPTNVVITPAGGGDKASIPPWVWGVGGALVLALAGVIGYAAANRKPKTPEVAAEKPAEVAAEKPSDASPEKGVDKK